MKKNIFVKFIMFIVMMFSFTACDLSFLSALTAKEAPAEMVGKYELTDIEGLYGLTPDLYEYNYIELEKDYTYHLENKAYGTITAQDGNWSYDEELSEITFTTTINESTYSKDVAKYNKEEHSFEVSSTIEGYKITMTFTLKK